MIHDKKSPLAASLFVNYATRSTSTAVHRCLIGRAAGN
jgi:hypothetical protein